MFGQLLMKIHCVIDALVSGGAQRQLCLLACGLRAKGHEVTLFVAHPQYNHFREELDACGIPVRTVERKRKTGFSLKALLAIRRLMAQCDAVISFQMNANIYAVIARLLSPAWRGRTICGERTGSLHYKTHTSKVCAWLTGYFSTITVTNSHTFAVHLRGLPGLSRKIAVIWNGYPPVTPEGVASGGASSGPPRLLVVGRKAAPKNGARLLHALQLVQLDHGWMPTLSWVGRAEMDAASVQMQREMRVLLSRDALLASRCRFLGEMKEVTEMYLTHDALILPSLYEGLPNVVCEAMLAGCPVIASDVCDNRLLLGDEERGLLCNPLSPQSIADAIHRFRTLTPEGRSDMIDRARRFAQTRLCQDGMVAAYEALLRR